MMIKLGSSDRLEEHLNPSRRKIPTVKHNNTPSTANSEREQLMGRSNSTADMPIKRCLFSEFEKKESSTQTPQNSAVLEQNQHLHNEIARFEEINRRLERHIDCRDKHLSKVHQDLKELLIKYNDELTRMKDDLCRELQESRRSQEISQIRPNNSDYSRHSKQSSDSLENILFMKETLDRMDFRIDPMGHSLMESLVLEGSPLAAQVPFRF